MAVAYSNVPRCDITRTRQDCWVGNLQTSVSQYSIYCIREVPTYGIQRAAAREIVLLVTFISELLTVLRIWELA